ncbi:hypothetical protein FRC09_002360 [Ceratobasidium sp. 395]|nr:hypothetical protein FRC09_002360 [Ceratobasidium sp. 395]
MQWQFQNNKRSTHGQWTTDPVQQIPDIVEKLASLTLLMLPSPATSDQQLTARETDLARVVLNTMVTLFKHEAARRVFASKRDEKDLELLRLNDAKTYPQLTLPIIRVVAVLGQDDDCVTRMDSYGRITTTLLELLVADDKLVSEAAAALVVLSKSDQGGKTISNQENLDKLFELLGSKTCFDEILQILANISQRYAREFDEIKVDYLAQLMNDHAEASIAVANIVTEDSPNRALALFSRFQSLPDQLTEETEEQIAEKTIRLLTHDDKRQVQAAVDIVKAFVERGKLLLFLLRLNVSSALADLLRSTSISQKLATEILDTVIQLALRGAGSITNDLIDYLTLLALEGDTQAMLAMLATAAYDKSRREGSQKYIHHLVPIVGSDNYRLIKQSIQALTVLTQHGYGQEDTLPNEVLNAVINLICSATEDTWYKSLESMDLQDETLVAAFNLIQAVSDDSTIRKLLIESGIFEAMLAVEDSSIGHKVHSKARDTLTSLGKQYSDLKLITDELISTEDALLALSNRRRFGEQDQEEEEESEDESEGEEVNETTALVGDRS